MFYLQWQVYKTLELIPSSVPLPEAHADTPSRADSIGRSLINNLSRDLSQEQQIQHLEECFQLEITAGQADRDQAASPHLGSKLVSFFKLLWKASTRDPDIEAWQFKDSYGEAWGWMTRP